MTPQHGCPGFGQRCGGGNGSAEAAAALIFGATLVVFLGGCAAPGGAPNMAVEPVPVYVAGHGMHTGLVVRSADVPAGAWPARAHFPHAEYLELGWGDREYYMHPAPGPVLALRAVLWPTDSAVHAVGFSGPIEREFPGAEIVEVHVSRASFSRLVTFVRESHAPAPNDLGPGQRPNSRFYASPRRFHMFETCNTWVARALKAAGLAVDAGAVVTAASLLRQVRRLAPGCRPSAACGAPVGLVTRSPVGDVPGVPTLMALLSQLVFGSF